MRAFRPVIGVLIALGLGAVPSLGVGLRAGAAGFALQDSGKTVWEGVYTDAQAARGQTSYKQICGHCHRDDLTGGGSEAGAPALAGPIFTVRWRDQPIAEMFLTIGTSMPKNKPDSLTPDVVIDIVGFLLKSNGMPAGREELPPDLEKLKSIVLTEKPQL
jgi:mono/diheme cytochrome c family protein